MNGLEIKRIMDEYGGKRQTRYKMVSNSLEYLIKDLQRLKEKVDRAVTAEPDECVNVWSHQLPENGLKLVRDNMIYAEKCSEVLSVLNDMLPEPDAE